MNINFARVLIWLAIIAILLSLGAFFISGQSAAISAGLAGVCCVVPNIIFLGGLHLSDKSAYANKASIVFVLEFIKIIISVVLIILVFWLYKDMHWIAFILCLVLMLKSYILLLLKFKR